MPKNWRILCSNAIRRLQAHTDALQQHLQWFSSVGDKESSDIIRSNCISCLAYLANLYLAIAPTDPSTAAAMERSCDDALSALGRLTEGVVIEEYSYFDLLLGVRKSFHARAFLSSHRCRCAGREPRGDSKPERRPSPWGNPPPCYIGGRSLPTHTHHTRINFRIANLPYFPP